jgi:hypothetical protein
MRRIGLAVVLAVSLMLAPLAVGALGLIIPPLLLLRADEVIE